MIVVFACQVGEKETMGLGDYFVKEAVFVRTSCPVLAVDRTGVGAVLFKTKPAFKK